MMKAYIAERIFTGNEWLTDHAVLVEQNHVHAIVPKEKLNNEFEIIDFKDCILSPAFIDIQLYGAYGKLLSVYPETDTLKKIVDYCVSGGATLCLPTVATNSIDVFKKSIDAIKAYWQSGGKGVYGLHIEGPWINKEKRGAHIEAFIHSPAMQEVEELLQYGKGVIKMITLAPEVCSKEVIDLILQHDIIISAGHSNATYHEATKGFNYGITAATHLYNAMSPLQHREPGMVGAIFNHPSVMCSVIPDGYHVDFAAIAIAKKIMGERLFAITDAVTETGEGPYQHMKEGDKYVCGNTLSGSALTMQKAFENLVNNVGIEMGEALRMCSLYPAKVLKQEKLFGKIAPGSAAQFIIINKQLKLVQVINE